MENYPIKSVTFGGFDKQDVIHYIEQTAQKAAESEKQLREENERLRSQMEELQEQVEHLQEQTEPDRGASAASGVPDPGAGGTAGAGAA